MLSQIYSSALFGIDAMRITVEASVNNGIGYHITGLPDDAIKESLSRIATVINSTGYDMPRTKLVINLAPADIRKTGTAFDLPICISILIASGQLTDFGKLQDYLMIGELGLDGSVNAVRGALCMAYKAKEDGFKGIVLPFANASEASLIKGIKVYAVKHLEQVIAFIQSDISLDPYTPEHVRKKYAASELDFKDVSGQENVKRAMEIAAAGGHNALIIGPPGTGKTMIAKRLATILPPMTLSEALETTRIYSVRNHPETLTGLISERPFREPHHSCSDTALAGGGSVPMPGEISLAHNGVLFLDEFPEFKRSAIEVLRQPMEQRKVLIARTKMAIEYPASFMLLAAMNPCLCGYLNHPFRACTCSKRSIHRYRSKISGPLLERIDLHITADPVPLFELLNLKTIGEPSSVIRSRVISARKIQTLRYPKGNIYCNAQLPDNKINNYCALEESAKKLLYRNVEAYQFSARSYTRILKIARTIADLAKSSMIEIDHVAEAIHYRSLDKPLIL